MSTSFQGNGWDASTPPKVKTQSASLANDQHGVELAVRFSRRKEQAAPRAVIENFAAE